MKFSCLIVDDEPYAIEIIESYVQQLSSLHLAGKCKNALEATQILNETKIDILFLDIEMPFLNGVDMIRGLNYKPKVILITAFRDYAVDGYELDVTDYLLKPVPFPRFNQAVNKAIASLTKTAATGDEKQKDHIFFKVDKKLVSVKLDDILYIESLKDYVRVKTAAESFIVYQTMNSLQEKLPESNFFRIQKSYIVALNKIKSIEGNMVEVACEKIPISRNCKDEVLQLILSKGISGLK